MLLLSTCIQCKQREQLDKLFSCNEHVISDQNKADPQQKLFVFVVAFSASLVLLCRTSSECFSLFRLSWLRPELPLEVAQPPVDSCMFLLSRYGHDSKWMEWSTTRE